MKNVFTTVKAKLKNETWIRHVALYKDQFRKLDEGKQQPFLVPAAFIEFDQITYLTNTDNSQTGTGILRVYLADKDLNKKDEQYFDDRIKLFTALQGLTSGEDFTRLNRIGERPDADFEQLNVWTIEFDITFRDNAATTRESRDKQPELSIVRR